MTSEICTTPEEMQNLVALTESIPDGIIKLVSSTIDILTFYNTELKQFFIFQMDATLDMYCLLAQAPL